MLSNIRIEDILHHINRRLEYPKSYIEYMLLSCLKTVNRKWQIFCKKYLKRREIY